MLALPGHWLNSQIIFIVSECYDKGGLRARGRFDTTLPLRAEERKATILCYLHWKIDSSFVFQTDCCSTLRRGGSKKFAKIKTAISSML